MLLGKGILETIIDLFNYLAPQSFMGLETQPILFFVIFIIFVYMTYRFFKLAFKAVLIFAAAAFFPIIANYFLGLSIPIDFNTILSYATTGLFLYIVGILLKSVVNIIKIVTWPFRKIFGESEEEEIRKEIEEDMEEEEE